MNPGRGEPSRGALAGEIVSRAIPWCGLTKLQRLGDHGFLVVSKTAAKADHSRKMIAQAIKRRMAYPHSPSFLNPTIGILPKKSVTIGTRSEEKIGVDAPQPAGPNPRARLSNGLNLLMGRRCWRRAIRPNCDRVKPCRRTKAGRRSPLVLTKRAGGEAFRPSRSPGP